MLGSVEEAVTGIRQRIAREPENAFLHELVGHVLRDLKRYPEAADSYEAALDIEPGREWAKLWLGFCRHQLGDDEGARRHVHAVLESRPADHEFIRCRAHRLKELQEYERAAIDFESGFRIWDGSAGHRYAASDCAFQSRTVHEGTGRSATGVSVGSQ